MKFKDLVKKFKFEFRSKLNLYFEKKLKNI